nr:MAG TPA: hypothetical protein [Caudoviricetes sp.]
MCLLYIAICNVVCEGLLFVSVHTPLVLYVLIRSLRSYIIRIGCSPRLL